MDLNGVDNGQTISSNKVQIPGEESATGGEDGVAKDRLILPKRMLELGKDLDYPDNNWETFRDSFIIDGLNEGSKDADESR